VEGAFRYGAASDDDDAGLLARPSFAVTADTHGSDVVAE
jgi:hypothetical protein